MLSFLFNRWHELVVITPFKCFNDSYTNQVQNRQWSYYNYFYISNPVPVSDFDVLGKQIEIYLKYFDGMN